MTSAARFLTIVQTTAIIIFYYNIIPVKIIISNLCYYIFFIIIILRLSDLAALIIAKTSRYTCVNPMAPAADAAMINSNIMKNNKNAYRDNK